MWKRAIFAFLPLILLLALPLILQPESARAEFDEDADTLVLVTPHTEQIRYEFDRAFRKHYKKLTGRNIVLDWRNVGGTSDIVRYIADRYEAGFRLKWEDAGNEWTKEVSKNFKNPKADPETCPERKMFLESEEGIGIDLFFGGGTYDQNKFAQIGFAVPGGVEERHPEWFTEDIMPMNFAGEAIRDPQGRYYGACLSSFGIAYNILRIKELETVNVKSWTDLTNPRYFMSIEVADPTKSGSINKCYEMILQQAMGQHGPDKGWQEGFRTLKLIVANSRCVTDSAGKVVRDVSSGSAAAGMCIDFYGFSEAEFTKSISRGDPRIFYEMPKNGSAVTADPIQLLRGAPNKKAAEMFLDFLLSPEGQAIWMRMPGTPGGPERTPLLRSCVRKDVYDQIPWEENSIGHYNPYKSVGTFRYRGEWTGRYFNLIRVLVKCIALDPIDNLHDAWKAVIENGGPENNPEAMELIGRLPFDYAHASDAAAKLNGTPVEAAAVRREWTEFARSNYIAAEKSAKQKGVKTK